MVIFLIISIFSTHGMEELTSNKTIEDYYGNLFTGDASTLEKCGDFFQTISDFENDSDNVSLLQSMRHQIVHASPDEKTIEDYHGIIFTAPASTIEKCGLFQNIGEFEDDFDFKSPDIWNQLFSRRFPKRDISFFKATAADIPLSKEILKAAFECITPFFEKAESPEDKREKSEKIHAMLESISKDQMRSIFSVINYLGPQKEKVAKKLAQQMKAIIPSNELKEENEIDFIILSKLYDKSIGTIIKKKEETAYFDSLKPKELNFQKMNIESLQGIEHIKIDKNNISTLRLSNNKLTTLNIKNLLEIFPNLKHIDAEHNLITKAIFPEQLPANIKIFLYQNFIKELMPFYTNDKNKIDLRNNPLSADAHENIKKALIPPFFKRNRHHLYFFKEASKSFLFNSLTGAGISTCFIWAPIGIIRSYKSEYPAPNTITQSILFHILLGTVSPSFYLFLKTEQLLGFGNSPSSAHKHFLQFVDKYALASSLIIGTTSIAWKLYKNELTEYKKHKYVPTAKIFTGDFDESAGI